MSHSHACPHCGSREVRASRRRGLVENLRSWFFQARPYRCRDCRRRFWLGPARRWPLLAAAGLGLALLAAGTWGASHWRTDRATPPTLADATSASQTALPAPPDVGRQDGQIEGLLRALANPPSPKPVPGPVAAPPGQAQGDNLPKVPDIHGKPLVYAEQVLRGLNLKYEVIMHGPAFGSPPNQVFSVHPPPGKPVPPGVNIKVHALQNPLAGMPKWWKTVPRAATLPGAEAERALLLAGLRPVFHLVPTAEPAMDGLVRQQSPSAGETAPYGTEVHLYVNQLAARR